MSDCLSKHIDELRDQGINGFSQMNRSQNDEFNRRLRILKAKPRAIRKGEYGYPLALFLEENPQYYYRFINGVLTKTDERVRISA